MKTQDPQGAAIRNWAAPQVLECQFSSGLNQFRSGPIRNGTRLEAVGEPDGPGGEENERAQSKDAEESRAETDGVDRNDAPDETSQGAEEARVVDEVVGEAVLLNPEHDLAGAGSEADSDGDEACDDKDGVDEQSTAESESAQNRREHENLH